MSIVIKTEIILNKFKVVEVKCLSYYRLPEVYLQGERPVIYLLTGNNGIVLRNALAKIPICMSVKAVYEEDIFYEMLKHCKLAKEHLQEVEAKLRNKRTFII